MQNLPRNEQIAKLRDFIDDIDVGMLTTVEADGTLRSRPMSTARDDSDGTLWFFTDENSPKVDEIEATRQVCVSYADPDDSAYVSISGTASIVTDRAKIEELWHPTLRTWFPEGLDDPRICLLKVEPEKGEYWDAGASVLVEVAGLAKALVTGQRVEDAGENEKVRIED